MMKWLEEKMRAKGLEPQSSPRAPLRTKLLNKADQMLEELGKYKGEDELDGNGVKYWWSTQSVNGQRRLVMREGGKTVEGSATYVDNTLTAVRDGITKMRDIIQQSTNDQWAEEEAARKKK